MKIISNKIGAIIFDMDGTIVESETDWLAAIILTLEKNRVSSEQIQEQKELLEAMMIGIGLLDGAKKLKTMFKLQKSLSQIKNDLVYEHRKKVEGSYKYIPGFVNFQSLIKSSNIPSGVATNAYRKYFLKVQETMKLQDFFGEHLYCVDDVNFKCKPDPAVFLYAARKLGVAPEKCLVFEDSLYGFMAAKAAGMKCIAIENKSNQLHRGMVDGTISSYDQAEELINKLF